MILILKKWRTNQPNPSFSVGKIPVVPSRETDHRDYHHFIEELMAKDFKDLMVYAALERDVNSVLKKLLAPKPISKSAFFEQISRTIHSRRSSIGSASSCFGSCSSLASSLTDSIKDEIEKNLRELRFENSEYFKNLLSVMMIKVV